MKPSTRDRALLLLTALLAAYQVSAGIDGFDALPIAAYTVAFGVLLVAALLIFILGFDALDSPIVAIVSTIIPLSLAVGLIHQRAASLRTPYLIFAIVGFLAVALTRSLPVPGKSPTIVLAVTHGIAGLTIFLLPIILSVQGKTQPLFSLVGVGGALIGVGGLLLSFLKTGKPILSRETIMRLFPGLLLLTTTCFVAGFKFGQ
ncbi:MAG: hypothetical protein DCC59_12715 [Chloroflexi bacterium]|nr:hypothetical protein [Chloroflexi bacterium CFX1]MCK6567199.1 hypothetical protein [Anaerolineales bacterium]MDL1919687.1 hypothetical protein [Chloroflexi bacterium CFX5]NUQ60228.1 hypothetical protein [Anaerolineales bacterium]RIK50750.1 MAG: hypothetical protein DCC59_12715 [Chloroflexota bacterium]